MQNLLPSQQNIQDNINTVKTENFIKKNFTPNVVQDIKKKSQNEQNEQNEQIIISALKELVKPDFDKFQSKFDNENENFKFNISKFEKRIDIFASIAQEINNTFAKNISYLEKLDLSIQDIYSMFTNVNSAIMQIQQSNSEFILQNNKIMQKNVDIYNALKRLYEQSENKSVINLYKKQITDLKSQQSKLLNLISEFKKTDTRKK